VSKDNKRLINPNCPQPKSKASTY